MRKQNIVQQFYDWLKIKKSEETLEAFLKEHKLPNSKQSEDALIGWMVNDQSAVAEFAQILKPSHFYQDTHAEACRAIFRFYDEGKPINQHTVMEALRQKGFVETDFNPADFPMLRKPHTFPEASEHLFLVYELALRRECITDSLEYLERAFHENIYDLLKERGEKSLDLISASEKSALLTPDKRGDVIDEFLESIKSNSGLTGIPSGLDLDKYTSGWQNGDLIILGARTGQGKTAILQNFLHYPATLGIPVGFFQIEMSAEQTLVREAAMLSDVPYSRIRANLLNTSERERIATAIQRLRGLPIYLDCSPNLSISLLRAKAMQMKLKYGVKMIAVDYLQLMERDYNGRNDNSADAVGSTIRKIKLLAKTLEMPILLACQLNREVEGRGQTWESKRPEIQHLRDSGKIEEMSDVVMLAFRPDYYCKDGETPTIDDRDYSNQIMIDLAKNKQSEPKTIWFACDIAKNKISNLPSLDAPMPVHETQNIPF